MKLKDIVDSSSLRYVKLEAICPIIVSAEFLKRAREKFLKATDRAVRIGSVASLTFAPYTPVFSSQKEVGSPKDNGHNLTVDTPLNLTGIPKTFEAPDGRRVIFGNAEREQVQTQEVSVFGLVAGLGRRGEVVISDSKGEKIREINLPPVSSLEFGQVQLSPDGTNLAVFRRFRVGQQDGRDVFLVNNMTGEALSILSDVARARDFYGLDFFWSPDGKRVAVQIYLGMGKDIAIIDAKSGGVLASIPTITWGQFSPDGEWYAALVRDRLEVVNINGPKVGIENISGVFSWSRDNRLLALYECTRWRRPPGFAPMCEAGNLAVYDLANQRIERLNIPALVRAIPIFSYDGSKILFEGAAGLSVFDRSTRRIIRLQLPSDIAVDRFTWFSGFHRSGDILLYGLTREASIVWINPENGQVRAYQTIEIARGEVASIREVTQDSIIYEVFRVGGDRRNLYVAPITKNNTPIRGEKVAESLVVPPQNSSEVLSFAREGDLLEVGGKNFLFQQGKKYAIENEESVPYFQGARRSFPEGLAPFIPEGEKISFLPGDVVGHKDLGIWYLRNGKRYKIQNWDWFLGKHKFDHLAWFLPPWMIEKIKEGEIPEPTPGTGGIRDWDGKMKEHQPFGGRMAIFMGGYNSTSESQLETFKTAKDIFTFNGFYDTRVLEPSYNLQVTREGVVPLRYTSIDTHKHPLNSVKYIELQIQRYKEMFPLTKFILIGHSLGGFVLFNAALAHADAIEAVITLDAPLIGVDQTVLAELTKGRAEIADWVVSFWGSEVGRYLVPKGDDPQFKEEVEVKTKFLISRGIKVITATNKDDIFIPEWVAVLDASREQAEKLGVQLVWGLGHLPPPPELLTFGGWIELVVGHGQIYQDEGVLRALIQPLSLP